MRPAVHVGPEPSAELEAAVRAGGGEPAPLDAADAVVWWPPDPAGFPQRFPDRVRWVQLPSAGVEHWLTLEGVDPDRRAFTSAVGVYGRLVAEHALALILASLRRLPEAARATSWGAPAGAPLDGCTVAIVGAGGIGRELIALLAPFDVEVVAVTRRGRDVAGAARTLPADRTDEVWPIADVVVIAAPATDATRRLVDRGALAAMPAHALLVNVARGSLVDTDALVDALAAGTIGGAALDVTDPEPLPDGHPLWREPRALVTAHVANPPAASVEPLAARVRENVARFAAGDELIGRIDPGAGY